MTLNHLNLTVADPSRDQRVPREVLRPSAARRQPRDPDAQRRPRHGAHAHQGSTGRQGRAGRSASAREGALRAEGAAGKPAAGECSTRAAFTSASSSRLSERVNEINRRLRDDGFPVDAPAHLHGSWTFYFTAPGGFTVEVLS